MIGGSSNGVSASGLRGVDTTGVEISFLPVTRFAKFLSVFTKRRFLALGLGLLGGAKVVLVSLTGLVVLLSAFVSKIGSGPRDEGEPFSSLYWNRGNENNSKGYKMTRLARAE